MSEAEPLLAVSRLTKHYAMRSGLFGRARDVVHERLHLREPVRSERYRDGPFGVLAQRQTRNAEVARLLLHTARVRQRKPAVDDEASELEFHGDAADLDRLFVVEQPSAPDPSSDIIDLDSTDRSGSTLTSARILETGEP